mmetsp:Transcript_45294/g.90839  ORF Transcript_45294/g.90839 Transcript_45294/m.90839 type:complete len:127 (-) Transcript_45294:23-403(-)
MQVKSTKHKLTVINSFGTRFEPTKRFEEFLEFRQSLCDQFWFMKQNDLPELRPSIWMLWDPTGMLGGEDNFRDRRQRDVRAFLEGVLAIACFSQSTALRDFLTGEPDEDEKQHVNEWDQKREEDPS